MLTETEQQAPPKRKRGRPRKTASAEGTSHPENKTKTKTKTKKTKSRSTSPKRSTEASKTTREAQPSFSQASSTSLGLLKARTQYSLAHMTAPDEAARITPDQNQTIAIKIHGQPEASAHGGTADANSLKVAKPLDLVSRDISSMTFRDYASPDRWKRKFSSPPPVSEIQYLTKKKQSGVERGVVVLLGIVFLLLVLTTAINLYFQFFLVL